MKSSLSIQGGYCASWKMSSLKEAKKTVLWAL